MSGHTQGPWRVERQNPSPTTGEWMISGEIPGYLAEVRDCGSGNFEANARLIAAAPELLESLEQTQSLLERLGLQSSDEYQDNAAAIAKGKGEQ